MGFQTIELITLIDYNKKHTVLLKSASTLNCAEMIESPREKSCEFYTGVLSGTPESKMARQTNHNTLDWLCYRC